MFNTTMKHDKRSGNETHKTVLRGNIISVLSTESKDSRWILSP